jgi:hypothetical protein
VVGRRDGDWEGVMGERGQRGGRKDEGRSRIPAGSVFYSKIAPALLIGLGVLTLVLILVAVGIVLRIVPFR